MKLDFEFETLTQELGFSHYGHSPITTPESIHIYESWLDLGFHGDMEYLKNHLPIKKNLQNLKPATQSIISLAHPYVLNSEQVPFKYLKIALYAQSSDYHVWLLQKLTRLCEYLKSKYPSHFFFPTTDSLPVLERDFAYQNQLGWIGKNSCLIDRSHGSLFLLGNILTDLNLDSPKTGKIHDFCGTCQKCILACPTQAIENNRTLNATKCISYWTIESKMSPPLDLASQFGDQFFGCDICQTVCPWNQKPLAKLDYNYNSTPQQLHSELKTILTSSNRELSHIIRGSALERSGPRGLRRNALILIGNLKIKGLETEIKLAKKYPQLSQLADWCESQLSHS